MMEADQILEQCASVLVVDWPSRDVPDTLARTGYTVVIKGGPDPGTFNAQEVRDGMVVAHPVGRPEQIDLVYVHRPFDELPGIVAMAKAMGAKALWWQSGRTSAGRKDPAGCWISDSESREARALVESAGLRYIDDVYIADAARRRQRLPGTRNI